MIVAPIVMAILLSLAIVLFVPFQPGEEFARWILAASILILVVVAVLFRSLTITIEGGRLAWSFGPGIIRKAVSVAGIASVEATRTSVIAGWGIHWTPRGVLYNVSGRDAVHIRQSDGGQFLLGTDEPAKLVEAIRAAQRV